MNETVEMLQRRIEEALYVNARLLAEIQQAHLDGWENWEDAADASNQLNDRLVAAKLLARQFDVPQV